MGRRYDTISFLSDFGTDDESVGVVRAVLRDLAPHVTVVDLAHGIAPFDVRGGALALARALAYLPVGVVLASVDPEAGAGRRSIAVSVAGGDGVLLGPDNGLLAPAIALAGGAEEAVVIDADATEPTGVHAIFAARDVLAPAAARLCNGAALGELGEPIDPAVLMPSVIPLPRLEGDGLECEVLAVDRFGNAQLNVGPDELEQVFGPGWGRTGWARFRVVLGDTVRSAGLTASFAGLGTGVVALVVDSSGMCSLAMERHPVAAELGLAVSDRVRLEPLSNEPPAAAGDPGSAGEGRTSPVTLRSRGPGGAR